MRVTVRVVLVVLGIAVLVEVASTLLMVWAVRTRSPTGMRLVKRINKYVSNPVVLRLPGGAAGTSVVHHVGRTSGTAYETPVLAQQVGDEVVVPLPYGPDVDWLRNVLAAGRATVDVEGRPVDVDSPEVLDVDEVAPVLSGSLRSATRMHRTREVARMHAVGAPVGPGWSDGA